MPKRAIIVIVSFLLAVVGAGRRNILIDFTDTKKMIANNLTLRPGDTIFLDHTSWVTIRDVFSVVTTAAIITAAVSQVIIASRR
jgi:hypothetical protein